MYILSSFFLAQLSTQEQEAFLQYSLKQTKNNFSFNKKNYEQRLNYQNAVVKFTKLQLTLYFLNKARIKVSHPFKPE